MKQPVSIIQNVLKIYTGNLELQMQWFPSSSTIYEKLKTSIVNHDLVLGMVTFRDYNSEATQK